MVDTARIMSEFDVEVQIGRGWILTALRVLAGEGLLIELPPGAPPGTAVDVTAVDIIFDQDPWDLDVVITIGGIPFPTLADAELSDDGTELRITNNRTDDESVIPSPCSTTWPAPPRWSSSEATPTTSPASPCSPTSTCAPARRAGNPCPRASISREGRWHWPPASFPPESIWRSASAPPRSPGSRTTSGTPSCAPRTAPIRCPTPTTAGAPGTWCRQRRSRAGCVSRSSARSPSTSGRTPPSGSTYISPRRSKTVSSGSGSTSTPTSTPASWVTCSPASSGDSSACCWGR